MSLRSFAIASSMFMNSNSLPIALMQSLVVTVPGLKWGDDDNKDAMVGRALTYLVLYSTLGMIVSDRPYSLTFFISSRVDRCGGVMVSVCSRRPIQIQTLQQHHSVFIPMIPFSLEKSSPSLPRKRNGRRCIMATTDRHQTTKTMFQVSQFRTPVGPVPRT